MRDSIVVGTIPIPDDGKIRYKVVRRPSNKRARTFDTNYGPVICVLPAFDEEVSIGSVVLKAKPYVDIVVVVDDGSSDKTANVARSAGAEVIKHEKNLGKGAALKTGFGYARNLNARAVVCLDSDGQHDPDEIPVLLKPVINGEADLINGSRFLNGANNVPRHRRVGQEILTLATNFGGQLKITDSQSGFCALSRNCLHKISFKSSGFGIESEMLMDVARAGLRIKEVPIGCRYDVDSHTKHSVTHGIGVLGDIINEVQVRRPLAFFCIPGWFLLFIGLIIGFQTVSGWLLLQQFWIEKAMLSMLFMLIGIFSIFTGIILNSISSLLVSRHEF